MNFEITSYGTGNYQIEVLLLHEPMDGVLVGMISSPLFKENIALALDSKKLNGDEVDYEFACLGSMADGSKPRIYMDSELIADLRYGTAEAKLILFHELGHYVNNDYLIARDSNGYHENRIVDVRNGLVSSAETHADSFAVTYIGYDQAVAGLEDLLQRMENKYNEDWDPDSVELAIAEIKLRISYQKTHEIT